MKMVSAIKFALCSIAGLTVAGICTPASAATQPPVQQAQGQPLVVSLSKPNIIYVLADDLGYGELGCYGQK